MVVEVVAPQVAPQAALQKEKEKEKEVVDFVRPGDLYGRFPGLFETGWGGFS